MQDTYGVYLPLSGKKQLGDTELPVLAQSTWQKARPLIEYRYITLMKYGRASRREEDGRKIREGDFSYVARNGRK